MQSRSRRPEIALTAITFVWGSTFIVTKQVLADAPPLGYLALRFCIAAGVLFLLFPRSARAPRGALKGGLILALGQTAGLACQVFAQVYTTASKTAFVIALSTAMTPLVGYALYRDRPRALQLAGVALASVGLAALTWPSDQGAWNRGDLLSLLGALAYAWVIVETPRRARQTEAPVLATLQAGFGALLLLLMLGAAHAALRWLPADRLPELLMLEARPFEITPQMAGLILYMALVCTVLTFLVQTWAMGRMTAAQSAVVFALEPVFATCLAIAVEGSAEWPGWRGVAGALLILAGLLVAEARLPDSR